MGMTTDEAVGREGAKSQWTGEVEDGAESERVEETKNASQSVEGGEKGEEWRERTRGWRRACVGEKR